MRIFAGIPLSEEIRRKSSIWQKQHAEYPVRFIRPENMHITLVPPWNDRSYELTIKRLDQQYSIVPFQIEFDLLDFDKKKPPSMIWLYGKTSPRILSLRDSIFLWLRREPEPRPFLLHSTLARFKSHKIPKFPQQQIREHLGWQMEIDKFVLYQSLGWSEYRVLHEFDL